MSKKHYTANQNGNDLNLMITGEIDDFWGMGLRQFANDISQSGASNVMIQINSPGGSVTEGNAIASFIKGYPANINTSGLGLVASIATIILLAGKKVSLANGSWFMIHNPSAMLIGTSEDLRGAADLLDKMEDQLADTYVSAISKNGKLIDGDHEKTKKKVKKMMESETWLSANEALEHGFIDTVTEGVEFLTKENALQMFNSCKSFKNAPIEFTNKLKTIIDMPTEAENKSLVEKFFDFFKTNPSEAKEILDKATSESAAAAETLRVAKISEAMQIAKDNGFFKEEVIEQPTAKVETVKEAVQPQANEEVEMLKKQIKTLEEKLGAPSAGGDTDTKIENKENDFFPTAAHKENADNFFKLILKNANR